MTVDNKVILDENICFDCNKQRNITTPKDKIKLRIELLDYKNLKSIQLDDTWLATKILKIIFYLGIVESKSHQSGNKSTLKDNEMKAKLIRMYVPKISIWDFL